MRARADGTLLVPYGGFVLVKAVNVQVKNLLPHLEACHQHPPGRPQAPADTGRKTRKRLRELLAADALPAPATRQRPRMVPPDSGATILEQG